MSRQRFYLHLLGGCPAFFDGERIRYAAKRGNPVTAKSLADIKRQRRLHNKSRRKLGFSETKASEFGHVLLDVINRDEL